MVTRKGSLEQGALVLLCSLGQGHGQGLCSVGRVGVCMVGRWSPLQHHCFGGCCNYSLHAAPFVHLLDTNKAKEGLWWMLQLFTALCVLRHVLFTNSNLQSTCAGGVCSGSTSISRATQLLGAQHPRTQGTCFTASAQATAGKDENPFIF